jgi:hypothetical protein
MTESMTRPLFEEPSADCEREDEWSYPKGFMFGGWSLPSGTTWEMAEQYFDAANVLVDSIERNEIEDYKLGTPILYLYRHWLELAVKSIIGPVYGHDLEKLSLELTRFLLQRGVEVPAWVTARLVEIGKIDRSSTAFRYAEGTSPGETYVNVPHLRDAMRMLQLALGSVAMRGVFPPESFFTLIGDEINSDWANLKKIDWIS